jgi:hypothetical protein
MGGFSIYSSSTYCINEMESIFYAPVQYSIPEKPAFMTKSRFILALAIIVFLSSCNRYITTYEAANRHNKCGKFIR